MGIQKLRKANQNLVTEITQHETELEKIKSEKAADETNFAGLLTALQKKVNDSEELVRRNDAEIRNITNTHMKLRAQEWNRTEKALLEKVATEEEAAKTLEV